MRRIFAIAALMLLPVRFVQASTFATFETSIGSMDLELYDEDKPITVSNFIKYATSGRFDRQFIQRWAPQFAIQGGGYYVTNTSGGSQIASVPVFGQIKNEYSVGKTYSNTYGTIAMARQAGGTNSATSQWFINLTNNSAAPAFLDLVDGGFTVFGSVISGTNVLNRFYAPPPTNGIPPNGIYRVNAGGALNTLPALTADPSYDDLIYVRLHLRRDLNLTVSRIRAGDRRVRWESIAGVTNVLEYADLPAGTNWVTYTNFVGKGGAVSVTDPTEAVGRTYRVKLFY